MIKLSSLFKKRHGTIEPVEPVENEERVIDLSDNIVYPASVLTNFNYSFSLGDDDRSNMLHFIVYELSKTSFRWGWDTITREQAEESKFLFRALCSMYNQHEELREAMLAAEGYRFVWKNKDKLFIPGLLSGEQLCELLTEVLTEDLNTIKYVKNIVENDERRKHLNPTYDDLMADMKKSEETADYYCSDMGCGMLCFTNKSYDSKQRILVNTALQKAYTVVDNDGSLVSFTKDDIDWDSVSELENNHNAYSLKACYYFGIDDYKDGKACVHWMLYPDGRYFADEDGFGMKDNDEVNVCGVIDTECRVVVKFHATD